LKVDGSKISGRVYTFALGYSARVEGSMTRTGKFQLRSAGPTVKGRITGSLRSGRIQGSGRLHSAQNGAARITLDGKIRRNLPAGNKSLVGTYVLPSLSAEQWKYNLYSYVNVIIKDKGGDNYECELYFAGKSGMRSDDVVFPIPKTQFPVIYGNDFGYRGTHFIVEVVSFTVQFRLDMKSNAKGGTYVQVTLVYPAQGRPGDPPSTKYDQYSADFD